MGSQGGGKPRPYPVRSDLHRRIGTGGACLSLVGFSEKNRPERAVILSAAKDLSSGRTQILRCAQDDSFFQKTYQ
jgi:hypothetical protein